VYYTTGFSRCEIQDLCALIEKIQSSIPEADRRDWPPILALGNSVVITLTYLRRNRVQWELAETYGGCLSRVAPVREGQAQYDKERGEPDIGSARPTVAVDLSCGGLTEPLGIAGTGGESTRPSS
jgi:hypothetical protein